MTRRSGPTRTAAALAIAILVTVVSAPTADADVRPVTTPAPPCDARVFSAAHRADVDARYPGHDVTASVVDDRNGCVYDLHPGRSVTTASVFKISVLARSLQRAQAAGRGLTSRERSLVGPMITQSSDPPTNVLFGELGGVGAFNSFFSATGMSSTATPSGTWGLTRTVARDQTLLVRKLIGGTSSGYTDAARAEAFEFMSQVVPSQRWGVSAGLAGGWQLGLKNGFFPSSTDGWRINTVGYARTSSSVPGIATAVLSHRWSTEAEGILAVEDVSRQANRLLTGTVGTDMPADAIALSGDWDGDGYDTPGFFADGRWWLTDRAFEGPATRVFTYGRRGDVPVVGDWDGDGRDEPAVVRGRIWHLRSVPAGGAADRSFAYGRLGDVPVMGDWNGDGVASPGMVRGKSWFLTDSVRGGAGNRVFGYGRAGDVPVIGDWDDDGRDEPGVRRAATWYLKSDASSGAANRTFSFGVSTDRPVTGRWIGRGPDGPGVLRGANWFLGNRPQSGNADRSFLFGR